ncbi:MAG: hypothetical protein LBJ64_10020 [Deltaproteobacteria bacterium]|jgi:predicted transposase YdaD|nr:hypothetical protein [Deltaproteobacteria bacterium]
MTERRGNDDRRRKFILEFAHRIFFLNVPAISQEVKVKEAYKMQTISLKKYSALMDIEEARELGELEAKTEVARAMLANNMSVNDIARMTGLEEHDIMRHDPAISPEVMEPFIMQTRSLTKRLALQEAREEGKLEAKIKIARAMFADNMSVNDIARMTGLNEHDIMRHDPAKSQEAKVKEAYKMQTISREKYLAAIDIADAREEGKLETKVKIARALLADNMSINDIARVTGLKEHDVMKLQ